MTIESTAETKKEAVGDLDPVASEFIKRLRVSKVFYFVLGLIATAIASIFGFTAGFIALTSTVSFFGGMTVAEAIFSETREAKK